MKIAIVGSSPSTCNLAPWAEPEWDEIWGLAWRKHPRADRLFEIHDPRMWSGYEGPDYADRLLGIKIPIYFRDKATSEQFPGSLVYPTEEVRRGIAPNGEVDIFTSSISYMLAFALIQSDVKAIGIWGVDMMLQEEYQQQRPAVEYLIGFARAKGIEIFIPPQSALCRANFVYGTVEQAQRKAAGISEEMLQQRIARYRKDAAETQSRINAEIARLQTLDGCIQEATQLLEYVQHFNRGGVIPDFSG